MYLLLLASSYSLRFGIGMSDSSSCAHFLNITETSGRFVGPKNLPLIHDTCTVRMTTGSFDF